MSDPTPNFFMAGGSAMDALMREIAIIAENPKHYEDLTDTAIIVKPKPPTKRVTFSGYGGWKYDGKGMKDRTERAIRLLKAAMADTETDTVVVHGTSGTMLIGSVLMNWPDEYPPRVVMLRKVGEEAHGPTIESQESCDLAEYVFLDDLICSGSTVRRVEEQMAPAVMRSVVLHDPNCYFSGSHHGSKRVWYDE